MNYQAVKNTFESEVAEEFLEWFGEYMPLDANELEEDDLKEEFINENYNTLVEQEHDCQVFTNNNLTIYLEMEKMVCKEWEDQMGEPYTERGLVKIVGLWKYFIARNYISENYQDLKDDYDNSSEEQD
tara:strand:+ start:262 stop:645 length:384 start_codon:yes stop_codon:yes gene_type:complete